MTGLLGFKVHYNFFYFEFSDPHYISIETTDIGETKKQFPHWCVLTNFRFEFLENISDVTAYYARPLHTSFSELVAEIHFYWPIGWSKVENKLRGNPHFIVKQLLCSAQATILK